MELDFRAFAFIITLAAVINGLGIVRIVTGFAEYLRHRDRLEVAHYWVFSAWTVFQFLLHILLWWSLWSTQAGAFNFITYLYLLAGPIILYLGTSLLAPDFKDAALNLREHYYRVRRPFFTVAALLWVWAIFVWPVLKGVFAPTAPVLASYVGIAVVLRLTGDPTLHAALVIATWVLLVIFIALFGMRLGGVAELL